MLKTTKLLSPEALHMLRTIAQTGSFAAASRELGLVPSSLTYRVRQIEDGLDVLLFDRSTRKAVLTEAGSELVEHGSRILGDLETIAQRVKRVATGWEPQFTLTIDSLISQHTVHELCEQFFALNPPTQLKLRSETLTGTMESLIYGEADLVLGGLIDPGKTAGIRHKPLGDMPFVFAIAPHHPLAQAKEPLSDEVIQKHRAVAVADTGRRGNNFTSGLLPGQSVFTVASIKAKLDAHLRGMGCGFLPEPLAASYVAAGQLVAKRTGRAQRFAPVGYAWREGAKSTQGKALIWWLTQLESKTTRQALLKLLP